MGKKGKKKPPAPPAVSLPSEPPGLPPPVATHAGIATDTPRTEASSWPSTPGSSWLPPSASRATAFERALAEAGMDEEAGTADADVVAPVAEKEPASGSTTPASAPAAANPSDVANLRARLEAAESRLEALRADFHYNLALLKDRDAELEAQDETIASLERAIAQRDVAAAELDARLVAATAEKSAAPGDVVAAAAVDRAKEETESTARHDDAVRSIRATHAAELETERRLRDESIAEANTRVEAANTRAQAAERDAQLAADARCVAVQAEAEARVRRATERVEEVERERDRLAETKQRLLDEYEEKCEKLVASMRDVEAHFESVQDDRERAERERAASEETWRSRVRALEGELEKAREKEADARATAARERDERVRVATRELAEKASELEREATRLASENERLGESLARAEGRADAAEKRLAEERERLETQLAETQLAEERERERLETERRRQRLAVDELSATHAKEHARLRARAESAEAAVEELRRAYAARSLAAAAVPAVDSKASSPEAEDLPEDLPEADGVATEDPDPPERNPTEETRGSETKGWTEVDPRETNRRGDEPARTEKGEEYWLERFDAAARAVSAAIASLPEPAPDRCRETKGPAGGVEEAGGMRDDGSRLRERMRALRASLSATRVDAGTPAPIDTAGKAKKKKTTKKKKASSPRPRQRRSSPSPSPSPSGSSGPKKLKNLEKALRALKARPRVAKKRAERKRATTTTFVCDVEARSAPISSFASHRTAFGRTTTDPLPGTYRTSPPRARQALDPREEEAVARLTRPKSSREVSAPPPPPFRPRGYSRPLGAVPRRPPREPFEPPSSFRAPSPPSPTPLDEQELSRFEAHWDKENARHRYASAGDKAGDGYFALSPRSKRWTTSAREGASREGIGPARDLIAAGEDRLAALERRRREHRALRMAMRFDG